MFSKEKIIEDYIAALQENKQKLGFTQERQLKNVRRLLNKFCEVNNISADLKNKLLSKQKPITSILCGFNYPQKIDTKTWIKIMSRLGFVTVGNEKMQLGFLLQFLKEKIKCFLKDNQERDIKSSGDIWSLLYPTHIDYVVSCSTVSHSKDLKPSSFSNLEEFFKMVKFSSFHSKLKECLSEMTTAQCLKVLSCLEELVLKNNYYMRWEKCADKACVKYNNVSKTDIMKFCMSTQFDFKFLTPLIIWSQSRNRSYTLQDEIFSCPRCVMSSCMPIGKFLEHLFFDERNCYYHYILKNFIKDVFKISESRFREGLQHEKKLYESIYRNIYQNYDIVPKNSNSSQDEFGGIATKYLKNNNFKIEGKGCFDHVESSTKVHYNENRFKRKNVQEKQSIVICKHQRQIMSNAQIYLNQHLLDKIITRYPYKLSNNEFTDFVDEFVSRKFTSKDKLSSKNLKILCCNMAKSLWRNNMNDIIYSRDVAFTYLRNSNLDDETLVLSRKMLTIILDADWFFDTGFKAEKNDEIDGNWENNFLCYCPLCINTIHTFQDINVTLKNKTIQEKYDLSIFCNGFKCKNETLCNHDEIHFGMSPLELLQHLNENKNSSNEVHKALLQYLSCLYKMKPDERKKEENRYIEDEINHKERITKETKLTLYEEAYLNKEENQSFEDEINHKERETKDAKLTLSQKAFLKKLPNDFDKNIIRIDYHKKSISWNNDEIKELYGFMKQNVHGLYYRHQYILHIYDKYRIPYYFFRDMLELYLKEDICDLIRMRNSADWESILTTEHFCKLCNENSLNITDYVKIYEENSKVLDYRGAISEAKKYINKKCEEKPNFIPPNFDKNVSDRVKNDFKSRKIEELLRVIDSVAYFDYRFQERFYKNLHNDYYDEGPNNLYFCPCKPKYIGDIEFDGRECFIDPMWRSDHLIRHLENKECLLHEALAVYLKKLYGDVLYDDEEVSDDVGEWDDEEVLVR